MNNKRILMMAALSLVLMACHNGQKNNPAVDEALTHAAKPADTAKPDKKDVAPAAFSCKGTIMSVSEVPVASRINEQIIMLGVEMGQRVRKGQVVARLDRTAIEDKIVKGRAELERAEYQYQNILMGQGYKRGAFDQAPENIRELARINSGYNTAKAALRQLEHQLTYCTIQAPTSGMVTASLSSRSGEPSRLRSVVNGPSTTCLPSSVPEMSIPTASVALPSLPTHEARIAIRIITMIKMTNFLWLRIQRTVLEKLIMFMVL